MIYTLLELNYNKGLIRLRENILSKPKNIQISEILNRFSKLRVLVIGDIMLDRYIFGTASRISPEAPVPVLKAKEEIESLGGAGNVAVNLKSLGALVELIGTTGEDTEGKKLLKIIKRSGIAGSGIIPDSQRSTTTKTRLIADNQQITRIDKEDTASISTKIESKLIKAIEKSIKKFKPNGIIISDYAKGCITQTLLSSIFELARKEDIFVTVDPKGNDYTKYKGAGTITPNQKEAELTSGIRIVDEETLEHASQNLIKQTGAKFILITRGKEGISYYSKKSGLKTVPSQTQEVFDVTGAGDTVVSAFTLSYQATNSLDYSVKIANLAAGIVVSRAGTASVTQQDLLNQFTSSTRYKLPDREVLVRTLEQEKSKGRKIVFTNGCFDLLHSGHLKLLNEAKNLGDILVVGINSDQSVKRIKGRGRPFVSEKERGALISALDCVDYLVVFGEDTPLRLIKELKPHIIVKGGDYTPKNVVGKEVVEKYGGEVRIIPLVDGISTSVLAERIKSNSTKKIKN